MPIEAVPPTGTGAGPLVKLLQHEQATQAGDPLAQRPEPQRAGWGEAWSAQVGMSLPQSFLDAVLSPRTVPAADFNPYGYIKANPDLANDPRVRAMVGAGQFDYSRSQDQFWSDWSHGQRFLDDAESLSRTGAGKYAVTMLGVALGDPTNLIPAGAAFKALQTGATAARVAKMAGTLGAANLALHKIQGALTPLADQPGFTDDAVSLGLGAMMGAGIGLLTSPMVAGRIGGYMATRKVAQLRGDMDAMLHGPGAVQKFDPNMAGGGTTSLADELAAGGENLKRVLAEDPVDNRVVSALHHAGDENGKLLEQLRARYDAAGKKLHVVDHPNQNYYDLFRDAEAVMTHPGLTGEAKPADFDYGFIDAAFTAVADRYTRLQSTVTPGGRLAGTMFGRLQDVYRTLSGSAQTVTVGSARDPFTYQSGAAAESIKGILQGRKDATIADLRGIWREAKRASGFAYGNEQVTGYGRFKEVVTDLMRREYANSRGFKVEVPEVAPPLAKAVQRVREYHLQMADELEQVGLLGIGPRAVAAAEKKQVDLRARLTRAESFKQQVGKDAATGGERFERTQQRIDKLQTEIAAHDDYLARLLRSTHERQHYLPRVYDVDRIVTARGDFAARLADSFRRKDSLVDGFPAAPHERRLVAEVAAKLDRDRLGRVIEEKKSQGQLGLGFAEQDLKTKGAGGEGPEAVESLSQKLTDADVREGDLPADVLNAYHRELDGYYQRNAEAATEKITGRNREGKSTGDRNGVVDGLGDQDPLKQRIMDINEWELSDYLVRDVEDMLGQYHNVVGGRAAVRRAVQLNDGIWGTARLKDGSPVVSGADMLTYLHETLDTLEKFAAAGDTAANRAPGAKGSNRETVAELRRRVDRDIAIPLARLEGGQPMGDKTGALAGLAWFGRNLLRVSFLDKMGSVAWAQLNDLAPVSLHMMQDPRTLRILAQGLLRLKSLPKRDLQVLGLAFDHLARSRSISDTEWLGTAGFGSGAVRRWSAAVERGGERLSDFNSRVTLMNWITDTNKAVSGALMIDRASTLSRRLVRAEELVAGGMDRAAALRKAGLNAYEAGRLNKLGFTAERAKRYQELLYQHGLTPDDAPIRGAMSFEDFLGRKDLFKPNFEEWDLSKQADRDLFDTVTANLGAEVERALVVNPGAFDKPLINNTELGRLFNQFATFGMAFVNQRLRVMSQMPARYQLWYVMSYMMLGAASDAVSNALAGRRSLDETAKLWADNPLGMTYAAWDRSGLGGWLNRPLAIADRLGTPFSPGNLLKAEAGAPATRHISGDALETLLGPAAADLGRGFRVAAGVMSGHPSRKTAYEAWKLAPYQNLLWLRMLHQATGAPVVPEAIKAPPAKPLAPQP